jgi:hypothetical protein
MCGTRKDPTLKNVYGEERTVNLIHPKKVIPRAGYPPFTRIGVVQIDLPYGFL